ncbi:MAG: hypothetical protein MUE73_02450 [Planctomycetes bacterium]|nr:hypothetical protein [Planctomycetota bacterium]
MDGTRGRSGWLAAAGVLVVAFAVYIPTFGAGFLAYDDYETVVDAPRRSFSEIWTGVTFKTWLPVTFSSLRIDMALFGTENAAGYRIVNALLHGLNALIVLLLARRLLGSGLFAFGAALLFALHPAATESVAWVSERKGLLAFLLDLPDRAFHRAARPRPAVEGERAGRAAAHRGAPRREGRSGPAIS